MGKFGEVNPERVELFERSLSLLSKMKNVSQAEALLTISCALDMPVDETRAFFTEGSDDEIDKRIGLLLSKTLQEMYGDDADDV
jgi:hypothetical protein